MRANLACGAMVILLAQGVLGCGDDTDPGGTESSSSSATGSGGSGGGTGGAGTGGTGASSGGNGSGGDGGGGSGGDGGGGSGGDGGAGGSGGGVDAIAWAPCSLVTDGDAKDAECAHIPVPLHWDQPEGKTITFFVKRKLAATQPSRGQLWLLNGGPGNSGVDFEPLVPFLASVDPTLDLYIPDHRGTGRSSRLGCADGETPESEAGSNLTDAEVAACLPAIEAELGDDIKGYTITNAARDVGETIARTRAPGGEVLILGRSYGTIWGHRYLQLYPDQPTAAALTGLAVNAHLSNLEFWLNDLGQRYMALCGANPSCAEKLGADPWATMTETLDAFDEGACPEVAALGYDRPLFQLAFARLLLLQWPHWSLMPALVYRLDRCSPADVAAFDHLKDILQARFPEPLPPSQRLSSPVLRYNITLSELWADPPPSAAEVDAFLAEANIALGQMDDGVAIRESWPRYTPDAYAGQWATTSVPLLLLQGELDFVPSAVPEAVESRFTGPNQTFVMLPRAPHTLESPTSSGTSCDLEILLQFIADPEAPLDTSCTERILPLDFSVDPTVSATLLGTDDAWDGDPGAGRRTSTASPEHERALARLREAIAAR
ncbi:alpha/beta fold hydrolase [Sorangium sp. So ce385]|uniref:alpha/beta fold hydrolase n=1 Tax=Sorangium sp. So ce385 TaxID=3133308 RepID=UPI003F5C2458